MQYDRYLQQCKILFPVADERGETRTVIFYEPMITFFLARLVSGGSPDRVVPALRLADWGEPLTVDEVRELARANGATRFADISRDNWHLLIRQ